MQVNVCLFDISSRRSPQYFGGSKGLLENEQQSVKTSGRISEVLAWIAEPSKLCGDAFQASGATFDHSGSLLDLVTEHNAEVNAGCCREGSGLSRLVRSRLSTRTYTVDRNRK